MLFSQYFGGGHEGTLPTVVDGDGCCQCGDYGFAGTYVALKQAVHGDGALYVVGYFFSNASLCIG